MKCPECNFKLSKESNFCSKCGSEIKKPDCVELCHELCKSWFLFGILHNKFEMERDEEKRKVMMEHFKKFGYYDRYCNAVKSAEKYLKESLLKQPQ